MTTRPIGIPIEAADRTGDEVASVERRIDRMADRVERDMARASGAAGGFRDRLGSVGNYLGVGFSGAVGVALGAVTAFAASVLSTADELDNMASRSGLSAEAVQTYGLIAEEAGSSQNALVLASQELQRRLAEVATTGAGPAKDALDALGISTEEVLSLHPDEQFALIRDRLSEVIDPAERLLAANDLLGRGGRELAGVLSLTAEEFVNVRERAEELGVQLTNEEVERFDAYEEKVQTLKNELRNMATDGLVFAFDALETLGSGILYAEERLRALLGLPTQAEEEAAALAAEARELAEAFDADVEALGPLLSDTEAYVTLLDGSTAIIDNATGQIRDRTEAIYEQSEAGYEQLEGLTALAESYYFAAEGQREEAEAASALIPLYATLADISYTAADAADAEAAAKARLRQQSIANQLAIAAEVEAYAALLEAQSAVLPIPEQYTETASQARRNAANLRAAAQGTYDPTLDIGPGRQPSPGRGRGPSDRPERPPRVRFGDYLVAEEGYTQDELDFIRRYGPRDQYGPNQRINLGQDISTLDADAFQALLDQFSEQYGIAITNFQEEQRQRGIEEANRRSEEAQRALAKMIGEELDRTRPPCPPVVFQGSLITERDAEQTISAIQERVAPKTRSNPITGATGT